MRLRILTVGGLLAVTAALLVDHGDRFGLALTHSALLGLALGSVLGLVPGASPAGRLGAFAAGFLAAWAGYAARAGYLPDIPMGRAIAAFVVVAVVTAVAATSNGRAPLWAGLVGVGALVGAYETAFTAMPTAFTTESVTSATTVALATALGFFATTLADAFGLTSPAQPEPLDDHTAGTDATTPRARQRSLRLPGQRIPTDNPAAATTKAVN